MSCTGGTGTGPGISTGPGTGTGFVPTAVWCRFLLSCVPDMKCW